MPKTKQSQLEYLKQWRKKNPNYYKEYLKKNPDKRKDNNEDVKNWRKRNPDYWNNYKKNPIEAKKVAARRILNNAITTNQIKRKDCEVKTCSNIGHAHHDNYNEPLNVRWLCIKHHKQYHSKIKIKKNKNDNV